MKRMGKGLLLGIVLVLAALVAILVRSRTPLASALPEGPWQNAAVIPAEKLEEMIMSGEGEMLPLPAETLEELVSEAEAWSLPLIKRANPAYLCAFTAGDRSWTLFVCRNGCIETKAVDAQGDAQEDFWRMTGGAVSPGSGEASGGRRRFWDVGRLYRRLTEHLEPSGPDA